MSVASLTQSCAQAMREVVEELWPELAHKLPPKTPRG